MFGFRGGESVATVERKRGYMLEAQKRWPFLTNFDATTLEDGLSSPGGLPIREALASQEIRKCPRRPHL